MPSTRLSCAACLALLASACGNEGSYELRWTIGCTSSNTSCEVQSAKDCSSRGLDSVEVVAVRGESEKTAIFPCFSPDEGPVGEGPGLEAGETVLRVFGLSGRGIRLTDPAETTVTIPESGLVQAQVNLPEPPACRDGADNDGDGLVDLFDPDCTGETDTRE